MRNQLARTGLLLGALLRLSTASAAPGLSTGNPKAIRLFKARGPIVIDGKLDDPGWLGAAEVVTFFEVSPGDNTAPPVRTTARITYDDRYLYISFHCEDPDPSKIRAPFVDRDALGADQDFVALLLDTRGDRQSASLFVVNPRGTQSDGTRNDATGNEDWSPDFFWDSAARVTRKGWDAELRIPFSSLRYSSQSLPNWGILLYRNYPRAYRYQMFSEAIPRGSGCEVCHALKLTGLEGVHSNNHLVIAPYITFEKQWQPSDGTGSPLMGEPNHLQGGADVKWMPAEDNVVDLTFRPDFSQIEADTAQISANKRFALFYPEKRPFFMEGVDLLDTPIQAAYTRSITDPTWGARTTGTSNGVDYLVLTARDNGGGSIIIPGNQGSDSVSQYAPSQASILRFRRTLGDSFFGFLGTSRDNEGGGNNRVLGPDFQWRPDPANQVTGQWLFSTTRTPNRTDLYPQWDGSRLIGSDLFLSWAHRVKRWSSVTQYADVSSTFRADDGFVPRVGYRLLGQAVERDYYPSGYFTKVAPQVVAKWYWDRSGRSLERSVWPGVALEGRGNLKADVFFKSDIVQAGGSLLKANRCYADLSISPSSRLPQITFAVTLGQDFDYANNSVGRGGDLSATLTARPVARLAFDLNAEHQWLDSSRGALNGRLFSADALSLEAVWTLSDTTYFRAIEQFLTTRRDPLLYSGSVASRDGGVQSSFLYSYKLNWQTALYVGYSDQQTWIPSRSWTPTGRQIFVKLSYAFQK